jgi:hypothetical protein
MRMDFPAVWLAFLVGALIWVGLDRSNGLNWAYLYRSKLQHDSAGYGDSTDVVLCPNCSTDLAICNGIARAGPRYHHQFPLSQTATCYDGIALCPFTRLCKHGAHYDAVSTLRSGS